MKISSGVNKNLVLSSIFIFFILLGSLFFLKDKISIFNQEAKGGSQLFLLKINDLELMVETADTPSKRIKGLSGRKEMPDNQGMLFVFKKPGRYPFWMEGMRFPIDIIWVNEDLEIIEIDKNLQPELFLKVYRPSRPAQYVLEVNAGFVDKHKIETGGRLSFNGS
ncbi:DUF192 domain-containing protein [Patescibacteria group bacterium]|nr:DUF192 domain-containing protein [Patescibacteria group bacterium]